MKIKRFVAKDIRQAMRMVKEELGADAVIMSNKSVEEGVEIVAARDFDDEAVHSKLNDLTNTGVSPKTNKKIELADFDTEKDNLHIVSSARKVAVDGSISKRPARRNTDQYMGYAEKISLAREQPISSAKPIRKAIPANTVPVNKAQVRQNPALAKVSHPSIATNHQQDNVSKQFMQEMRDEIKNLKTVFNSRLSEVAWNQGAQSNPVRSELLYRLGSMGISKKLTTKIANRLDNQEDAVLAFEKAKEMLGKVLPVTNDDLLEQGGIIALVGPTGVGKTTTIAKLAAKFSLKHGAHEVALITTDNYRIGAHEQIATYGKLLDVPVRMASNGEQLRDHINSFSHRRLILIDTAGMSQRDMRLANQIETLRQENINIKTYLVMSAATEYRAIKEIIQAFKVFEPEASILTKLDETVSQGSTLSAVIEHQLPLSFMTNGQQVPEDIYKPDAQVLIEQCATSMDEEAGTSDELNNEDWVAEGYA
jgi:flagellar biosynthesis protein FlhF